MRLFPWKIVKIDKKAMTMTDNTPMNIVNRALYGMGFKFVAYDQQSKVYIESGYNINPDVYAVVSQKATEVQRIPYYIKSVKDEGHKERYQQFRVMIKGMLTPELAIKKAVIETKAFHEEQMAMPLERPNPNQTWREFFALYETFMDLTGNFYIYCLSPEEGTNAGTPKELYILPSHLMQIVLRENVDIISDEDIIDYYILTEGFRFIKFQSEKVIHVKLSNPNFDLAGSHLYGQSPLRAALKNIQSSNEALTLNAKLMANGGSFGLISGKQPLTNEQAQQLKDRIVEMDNSTERMSNIAGVSIEPVFTRISLTTDELKPFDYLEYDQKSICNVLHWDDKLLNNADGAKYDNYKTALRRAITSGISPNLRLLEEAFNNYLLPMFKGYENTIMVFDETQLPEMQEDMAQLSVWLNSSLDRGVINREEYRVAINYEETGLAEMSQYTVGGNIMSLEEALDSSFSIEDSEKKNLNFKAGFKPRQSRDSDGQWSTGGGSWHKIDTKTVIDGHNKNGGSTFGMDGKNKAGAKGMGSVSTFTSQPESIILKGNLTEQDIKDFLEINKPLLENSSIFGLGTWYSIKNDITYLDIVNVIKLQDAIKLGIKHNQEAIFDLENMMDVPTGGTGIN